MKRMQKKNFYDYSWLSNPNAVYIGRPSLYGNPFTVKEFGLEKALLGYRIWLREQIQRKNNRKQKRWQERLKKIRKQYPKKCPLCEPYEPYKPALLTTPFYVIDDEDN